MTTLAIATGVYWRPHETQIRFHLANLFGGSSVVLAEKPGETPPDDRPAMIWGPKGLRLEPVDRLREAAASLIAYPETRSIRVPQGPRRAAILRFLAKHDVDAVLCEFGTEAVRIAPVANAAGLPVFTYFRGADASSYLSRQKRIDAYRKLMPRLTGVFSVSQFLLDTLAAHGITHPNAHVIPSGVDTDRFTPQPKTPGSFLAVGRFIEKKRPDITLRAFVRAAADHPQARLTMIGDGPMLDQCRVLAQDSGLADRIDLPGRQPHDVVAKRMAESEVFLQHSVIGSDGDTEGLPTSIQEAMACGMVTVSTRHAGIPEAVVEGQTGWLTDEHDEAGFTDAIARCLSPETDLSDMGTRARDMAVERFDNRTLIKRVEHEIARAVAQR